MNTEATLPWMRPGWMELAQAWIQPQLAPLGITLDGQIEPPNLRPWSIVLRIPTTAGYFFFKASAPVLAHEPVLTQALYQWRPDCIQTVLAVDADRAWMLMPDESPWLRALIQNKADLRHWETILPMYAGLQIDMAGRWENLLALGALDRRLSGLAGQFEMLLRDRESLLVDQPDGLTMDQYRQLTGLVPRFEGLCRRLASLGLPETLHHDDFHDGNVFFPNGRYAFSDWGESCVAHPFFTLLVTLRSIAYRFDLPYGAREHNFVFAPEILSLRDRYLAVWEPYGSPADLLDAFQLSWPVAMVNRALTWHRVVAHLEGEDRSRHISAVAAWLQEFLDAMEMDIKL